MYACQLWNNFLSSSLKRIRVAYNNSFRFLHGLARYVSAREQHVLNNITAILRKISCSFVYRCYDSNDKLIFSRTVLLIHHIINTTTHWFICNRYLVTFFF